MPNVKFILTKKDGNFTQNVDKCFLNLKKKGPKMQPTGILSDLRKGLQATVEFLDFEYNTFFSGCNNLKWSIKIHITLGKGI